MTHTRKVLTASDLSTGDILERCVVSGDCTGLVCTAHWCDLINATNITGWTLDKCALPPTHEDIEAGIDAELDEVVSRMVDLSNKYPAKVAAKLKDKVDKATTEGLLSADGKPQKIDSPQGWK